MGQTADQCKVLGNDCMKNQDFMGAVKNYALGLKLDPENPILNCNMAQAYLNLRDYGEAEKFAKKAIKHRNDYVKAYYRAAKGALGRYNVYDSMMFLAQGIQNCLSHDVEELFLMAKELSPEFENALRSFQAKEKSQVNKKTGKSSSSPVHDKKTPQKGEASNSVNTKLSKKSDKSEEKLSSESVTENKNSTEKARVKEKDKLQAEVDHAREKRKKLDEEEEILRKKLREIEEKKKQEQQIEEQKIKELELQEKERKAQELKDKDKEKAKKAQELKEKEKKAQELKEKEKKAQELKEKEKKAQELKEKEKKAQELKEKEKKAQELKEKEKKAQELKEKEKKAQELKEKEKKAQELKEKEKKAQELKEKRAQEFKEIQERMAQEAKEKVRLAQEIKDKERKAQELMEKERKQLELKEQERKEREKREKEKKAAEEVMLAQQKAQQLMRLKNELYNLMRDGSIALMKGLYKKAIDSFNKAFESINSNPSPENLGVGDPKDIVVLHFAFSQARIYSHEYTDIVKAIQQLDRMVKDKWHIQLPAIFLLLGNAYIRLNRFSYAIEPLNRGMSYLNKDKLFPVFSWPGTNDVIELTDRTCLKAALQSSIQTCKQFHKPDAVCFYENCSQINQHILPSQNIYFSDPDFVGFIHIVCQQRCHVYFHLSCWKDFKENMSEVQKLNEKDFLGRDCLTPDCVTQNNKPSAIIKIITVGPDGEEKSSCEFTPPPPSPSVLVKETDNVDKSPKKKQRKRQTGTVNLSKRTRKESKSQSVIDSPVPQESGQQYKDALAKLAAARQSNFGYGAEAPGPHKVNINPAPLHLERDEEFVYSYFLEIFKKEGYMSIYKLQEHWETNKELLPVLKPALITHTDLVKFLLDTNGFAVVQDMIGITSELPNISAIVEANAEVPLPSNHGWKPSAATVFETSKTLSFTSTSDFTATTKSNNPDSSVISEKGYSIPCELDAISLEKDVDRWFDTKSSASCSSEENSAITITNTDEILAQTDTECGPSSSRTNTDSREILPVFNVDKNHHTDQQLSELININNINNIQNEGNSFETNQNINETQKHDLNSQNNMSSLSSTVSSYATDFEQKASKSNCDIEKSNLTVDSKILKPDTIEMLHCKQNGNLSFAQSSTESVKHVIQTPLTFSNTHPSKSMWKPRAKLLEWASETFPGYSRSRLWEALTLVRAQNNYTLSGLSFSVIEDRVQVVLQQNDDF